MKQSEINGISFFDTLPPKVTSEQFQAAVAQVIGQEDYDLLGEDAPELITDSLAYLGAFAPEPATFDIGSVQAVTMLEEQEVQYIVDIGVKLGLLKRKDDRFLMESKIVDLFQSFLT